MKFREPTDAVWLSNCFPKKKILALPVTYSYSILISLVLFIEENETEIKRRYFLGHMAVFIDQEILDKTAI